MEKKRFEITSINVQYDLLIAQEEKLIQMNEADFNKLFEHIQTLQTQIEVLQEELIKELKKQALIRNILNNG